MTIWQSLLAYGLVTLVLGVFMLPVIMSIRNTLAERRENKEIKQKVHDAIDKITADGKIEGPKGPYVPRKHSGPMTDGSTKSPTQPGYYNHPWA